MKLGIMQPYLFPYIGYFQLIKAVDKYVVYDDVNYIKGGWINRNNILLNGNSFLINLNLQGASSFKNINEISVGNNRDKLLKTIAQAYKSAPFYSAVFPLIENIFAFPDQNLALFIKNSLSRILEYLHISTPLILSSSIEKDNSLRGQDKVISICKLLGATDYYNAIGGKELYSKSTFEDNGINLCFLKTDTIKYPQSKNEFISNLSIIDVMMFNSPEEINKMLDEFELS